MKKQSSAGKRSDQRGMASIVVTMITMVVISLIVVGFATISRREQRQSLDQLLSAQAFYAAESGIEDAKSIIKAAVATNQPVIAKDNCTTNNPSGTYPTGNQTVVDATYDVSYTCLKVDPTPESLLFDGIGENGVVVPVNTTQDIGTVRISWRPSTAPAGTPAACPNAPTNNFSPQTQWQCGYGVLRLDAVLTNGSLTRAGLTGNQLTGFFVPTRTNAGGQLSFANRGQANVVAADCNTAAYTRCEATITNLPAGTRSLSLRLGSMYQPSNLMVEVLNGTTPLGLNGVQAVIDSTGKATDVLRRIQVRLPIVQTGGLMPNYTIQSNSSICKRFGTTPTYFNVPGDIVEPDTDNDMCVAKTDGTP